MRVAGGQHNGEVILKTIEYYIYLYSHLSNFMTASSGYSSGIVEPYCPNHEIKPFSQIISII